VSDAAEDAEMIEKPISISKHQHQLKAFGIFLSWIDQPAVHASGSRPLRRRHGNEMTGMHRVLTPRRWSGQGLKVGAAMSLFPRCQHGSSPLTHTIVTRSGISRCRPQRSF
jgi:hypothetical protein